MPLLELRNLETTFDSANGQVSAVRGIDLTVKRHSFHALVGQSGAGKSILALSVLRLLPDNARISGNVFFQGRDLLACPAETVRGLLGKEIMMVFQNPSLTLNPVMTIERQLCEIPVWHEGISSHDARHRALKTMALCELPNPEQIMRSYPHELSGGMLQRVAIAMAIITRPNLLIADEPFKGLDARLQQQVAATLHKVCRELAITLLIITHNLKIAQSLCNVVSVMYDGRLIETAASENFFSAPHHPYSERLVHAFRMFSTPADGKGARLIQ